MLSGSVKLNRPPQIQRRRQTRWHRRRQRRRQMRLQGQRRPPEKAGGRYKVNDDVKFNGDGKVEPKAKEPAGRRRYQSQKRQSGDWRSQASAVSRGLRRGGWVACCELALVPVGVGQRYGAGGV